MGRLIDADAVKKRFPIMVNDFGMTINERLHKELDKIPTVEAIPKADYEARLKADLVAMLTDIQLEIEELDLKDSVFDYQKGAEETREYISDLIQQKIDVLKGGEDDAGKD